MLILDNSEKKSETNDIIGLKKQPLNKWKYFAKLDTSTIDIIIFKMVITEGWDIRRACMLYQVRDTKSKQLDEQVIGRVRRNPRLLDFETLDKEAQELISTAYVWGIKPQNENSTQTALLFGDEENNEIQKEIRIQTTRLKQFETAKTIDIEKLALKPINTLAPTSIFDLYRNLQKTTNEVQAHYKAYVNSYDKFFTFTNNLQIIKKEINKDCCDYSKYIEITKDENDKACDVTFPYSSSFAPTADKRNIDSWAWRRENKDEDEFSFDSQSEKEWVRKLLELQKKDIIKTVSIGDEDILLLGKNFVENSEIKYEYYSSGRHFSYPDFVLKDKKDRIHIFEVKSLNSSSNINIDSEEYVEKVRTLKDFYKAVSKITPHFYYLPIKKGDNWHIWQMKDGNEKDLTMDEFVDGIKG